MDLHVNISKKLTNRNSKEFVLNAEFKCGNEMIVLFSGAGKTLDIFSRIMRYSRILQLKKISFLD